MTDSRRGFCLALACCTGNACFLIAYKLAAGLGDAYDATLVMLASAAVLNTATSLAQERGQATVPRDRLSWLLALALSALTLVGNEFAVEAVHRISAPLTSVLQQSQIPFVALLGVWVLSERTTARFWLGALIAASGLYFMQSAAADAPRVDQVGVSMAVGSAASFAVMSVYTRKYIYRIRPIAVNALRLWISVALWFAVHRRMPRLPMRPEFVAYCALAGAFGPYLSRTALMYALKYISPTRTTLVGLLTPAITIVPAYWVFATIPSARELVGSAIMIAGVAIPVLEQRAALPVGVVDPSAAE
jgi:drug/metabolite transporter (DMT)-like permease